MGSWSSFHEYRSQCLFNAITNMKNCKLYTEMINDEEFVLFYQIKDRTFPGKTKFIWKCSQNLLKLIADLIWRRNSLARGFNFLPLTRQWKYTKRSQHINCLLTFAKQRSYSSLEKLSTVQTDAVSVDWSSYDGNMSITWEQNRSLLYLSWKKADFDLRVTVGDKQIRFFHYMKRLPATRRVKFTKKNNMI